MFHQEKVFPQSKKLLVFALAGVALVGVLISR